MKLPLFNGYGGEPYKGLPEDRFKFLKHELVEGVGLYDLEARLYDPTLGRFAQIDPMPTDGGQDMFSPYHYGSNNPVLISDPNGRCGPCFFIIPVLFGLLTASQPALAPSGGKNTKNELLANKKAYNESGMDIFTSLLPGSKAAKVETVVYAAVKTKAKKEIKEEVKKQAEKVIEKAKEGSKVDESRSKHIFRESEGHFPNDTPAARKKLESTANNPDNKLGNDKYGNEWNAEIQKDGTQIWTQSRDGKILNGGVNETPRSFNPETGLSAPTKPK